LSAPAVGVCCWRLRRANVNVTSEGEMCGAQQPFYILTIQRSATPRGGLPLSFVIGPLQALVRCPRAGRSCFACLASHTNRSFRRATGTVLVQKGHHDAVQKPRLPWLLSRRQHVLMPGIPGAKRVEPTPHCKPPSLPCSSPWCGRVPLDGCARALRCFAARHNLLLRAPVRCAKPTDETDTTDTTDTTPTPSAGNSP